MADLPPAFWLASARLDSASEIAGWLKSVHVQLRWLDEVVIISEEPIPPTLDLPGLEGSTLVTRFNGWAKSQQPLLHDACRKTANGEKEIILVVSQTANIATAALVGSPVVVGRYNLIPAAYLENRLSFHLPDQNADLLETIQSRLIKSGRSAAELNLLAFQSSAGKRPVKSATPFAGAAWLNRESGADRNALAVTHDLVTSLSGSKKKNGLIIEIDSDYDLFATWVEAV